MITDDVLLRTWLHNRPATTARAYRADIAALLRAAGKPLAGITLADLQNWSDTMRTLAPATRHRRLAAAKSLFRYAYDNGAFDHDASRALRVGKPEMLAAERSLTAEQVGAMLAGERDPRRHAALRLLYICGLRASEACALTWANMTRRARGAGEVAVLGKGGKRRMLAVPAELWRELVALNPQPDLFEPVLPGRDGKKLSVDALDRLVKRAARRAGLPRISPHWLRHACASHALDKGCPPHVVQRDLGHASLATTTRYAHAKPGQSSASYLVR
mgnify:CR=1 FL=1